MQTQNLASLYKTARKSGTHIQMGLYAFSNGVLSPKLEQTFLQDLHQVGQISKAWKIWAKKNDHSSKRWRSTGVAILSKMGNIAAAEKLAAEGIYPSAKVSLARAHAKHENVIESLQWLKSCPAKLANPVMEELTSASRQLRRNRVNVATALTNMDALKPNEIVAALPNLKGSFWRENHSESVKDALIQRGIDVHPDTSITTKRCLSLLGAAIKDRNHKLAEQIFTNRPQDGTCRNLQLELRFFFFNNDFRTIFNTLNITSLEKLNEHNWWLVWKILQAFDPYKYPGVVAPDPQELYKSMIKSRGLVTSSKMLNSILRLLIRQQNFGFMLAMLEHWYKQTTHELPHSTLQMLESVANTTLSSKDPKMIVEKVCVAKGANFQAAEAHSRGVIL